MPIEIHCPNGHTLRVMEQHAGKRVRCPACQALVTVPLPGEAASQAPTMPPPPAPPAPAMETKLVNCPNHHPVRVTPAMAARKVRCPTCHAVFVVEPFSMEAPPVPEQTWDQPEEPPPPDEELEQQEYRPRKRGRRSRLAARRARRLGLKIVGWGLLLNALGIIAQIVAGVLFIGAAVTLGVAAAMAKPGPGGGPGGGAVGALGLAAGAVIVGLCLVILAPILSGAGKILCCWVPRQAHGRGLVIASIICDVAQFVVPILMFMLGFASAGLRRPNAGMESMILQLGMNILAIGLAVTSVVLFLAFLARVAQFVDEPGYAEEAGALIIWVILIGLSPIVMIVLALIPFIGACIGVLLALAILVFAIIFIVRYLRLLFGLRSVVS